MTTSPCPSSALKACFRCGIEKPMEEFYAHPMMGDGHLGKCKDCTKTDVRQNRKGRLGYYRTYDQLRQREPERRAKQAIHAKKWGRKHPERRLAHRKVSQAVHAGLLTRKPCEVCGSDKHIHAHHDDYDRPLDVVWLCPVHHFERHRTLDAMREAG